MPDVVIVGGGIIGASCANELASRGASVALLERDHLAAHASGRNQGLWLLPDDDVNVAMALASLEVYRQVAAEARIDVRLDDAPVGSVLAASNAREVRLAEDAVARARRHGFVVDDISEPAEIRDTEPGLTRNLAGAWLVHTGHRLDPGALTVALALAAAEHGADIRHHVHARALLHRGDLVAGVVTDDGVIEATTTIVAAGPWSSPLLEQAGVYLPIIGARGWLVRVAPRVRHLLSHLVEAPGPHAALRNAQPPAWPDAGVVIREGAPGDDLGALLHPHRDGRTIVIGSTRQIWLTPEPPEERIVGRLLAAARELVPAIDEAAVQSSWWGLRPLTPDERPLIGAVREGLHVATGHGSEGVILGAGTAQLVAAHLADEAPPFDAAPFDPLRFDTDLQPG
ncbi:MAG TPA: FAD-binding oxidoreductase [Actinomycetota bacterium]|nr:FAD-binding oxidoreductase [Actinomycetota bacterium]